MVYITLLSYNIYSSERTLRWRKAELAEAGKLTRLKLARSGRKQPYGLVRFVQWKQGKLVPDLWRLEYTHNMMGQSIL